MSGQGRPSRGSLPARGRSHCAANVEAGRNTPGTHPDPLPTDPPSSKPLPPDPPPQALVSATATHVAIAQSGAAHLRSGARLCSCGVTDPRGGSNPCCRRDSAHAPSGSKSSCRRDSAHVPNGSTSSCRCGAARCHGGSTTRRHNGSTTRCHGGSTTRRHNGSTTRCHGGSTTRRRRITARFPAIFTDTAYPPAGRVRRDPCSARSGRRRGFP